MAYQIIPGQTTLGTVRQQVRLRCDIVNSQVCTDDEINSYVVSSQGDLYDLLVWKFGDNYAVAPDFLFVTDGQTDYYPFPSDFFKLLEVHLQWSASPTGWTRIRRTELSQVTRYTVPNMVGYYGATDLVYVIRGQTTSLPVSSPIISSVALANGSGHLGAGTYAYAVTATTTVGESLPSPVVSVTGAGGVQTATITWAAVPGATGYNVYGRLYDAIQFVASVGGGSNTSFADTGLLTPSGALPSVGTALYNGPSLWLMPRAQGGQTIRLIYIPRLTVPTESGTATFDGVAAGDTFVFQGVTFTCVTSGFGTSFAKGATDTDTAANFVTVFNTIATTSTLREYSPVRAGYVASSDGNVVTIALSGQTIYEPTMVTWSAPTNIALSPVGVWSNLIDGVNHWEEYIVCDTAIKVQDKQDLNSAPFVGRKQQILDRIEIAASNRDAGSPKRVVDTMGLTGWGWTDGGDGYPGGRW